jgi:hypothetical protein
MSLSTKRDFVNGTATAPNVKWVLDHTPTLSKTERAYAAADWYSGRVPYRPTIAELAARVGVSTTYVCHAIRRQTERSEVLAGHIPLAPPSGSSFASRGHRQLARMARKWGVERLLEMLAELETADTNKPAANGLSPSPSPIFGNGNGNGGLHSAQ